jgi:hypothetical protein
MHTGILVGSIAAAAITLTVAAPLAAHPSEEERAFCLSLTHKAVRTNAQAGRWLDRVTRHDGVSVACDDKRVEFRRFMTVTRSQMGEDWEERAERTWSAAQCNDPRARQAIERGWTIRAVYTTATGDSLSFNAECD